MGTGISRYAFRGNTGAVAIGFNGVPLEYSQPEVLISNCNFTRNRATASALFRSSSGAFFNQAFSGRGGGLGIFFNEDIRNVSVNIADNVFQSNYARSFGGAVFLVVFNEGTHHTLQLQRNIFHSNVGMLGGGAIQMTFISNGIAGNPHMTLFTDCSFVSNSGASGGAVYVYPAFEGTIVNQQHVMYLFLNTSSVFVYDVNYKLHVVVNAVSIVTVIFLSSFVMHKVGGMVCITSMLYSFLPVFQLHPLGVIVS